MRRPPFFIWVEGGSDARFFEGVLKPLIEKQYARKVIVRTYASMRRDKLSAILRAIIDIGADYLIVTDNDCFPCVTSKKQWVCENIKYAGAGAIRVVVEEIESWYASGLDEAGAQKLDFPVLPSTDKLTKEQFNALVPPRFASRIDFMMEVLKVFSIQAAEQSNRSFRYFISKQGLGSLVGANVAAFSEQTGAL